MTQTDQDFREEFKPLYIPPSYELTDTLEDRTIFSLANIGEGTSEEVFAKMKEYEPEIKDLTIKFVKQHLHQLYQKGLIKGNTGENGLSYNLSKITTPNKGRIDPDLLAPGLD